LERESAFSRRENAKRLAIPPGLGIAFQSCKLVRVAGLLELNPSMMFYGKAILFLVFALPAAAQEGGSGQRREPLPSPASSPERSEAHNLMEQGRYREALEALKKIELSSPNAKGLAHDLGGALYHLGNFADAVPALQRALAESADDHEAEQLLGISFFQLGKSDEAIHWLLKLKAAIPPGNPDAEYVLGLCYLRRRDYERARGSFAAMYGVPPESAAAYLFSARMVLRQGDDSRAEELAQKAAAIDSRLPLAHFLLGEIYLYRSNLPKAISEFEQEIRFNPAYAGSYDRLADTYLRMARLNEAEALLKRSLLLDSNSTGPYILLGKVHLKKKDYPQATMYLERAIKMDPNNYISHHLLGEAYQGAGKLREAEHELTLAEQLQSARQAKLEEVP
jgi:tetratricopeptide (TPR) repeat protein